MSRNQFSINFSFALILVFEIFVGHNSVIGSENTGLYSRNPLVSNWLSHLETPKNNRNDTGRNSNWRYLCQEDTEDAIRSVTSLGIMCNCPKIFAPVCGSDNVTYHNRCFMHCRAKHVSNRYHRYKLTLKKFGECKE